MIILIDGRFDLAILDWPLWKPVIGRLDRVHPWLLWLNRLMTLRIVWLAYLSSNRVRMLMGLRG